MLRFDEGGGWKRDYGSRTADQRESGWIFHRTLPSARQSSTLLKAMCRKLAYVPVPGLGQVAMLFPSVIPSAPSDPLIEFTIRVPAVAAHGDRIEWPPADKIWCRIHPNVSRLSRRCGLARPERT